MEFDAVVVGAIGSVIIVILILAVIGYNIIKNMDKDQDS